MCRRAGGTGAAAGRRGWRIWAPTSSLSPFQRFKVQFNKGEHGFDNDDMNMKTIFRAVGPAFRQGLLAEPFESVNVYPLLCHLLGITPEPHNGSLAIMEPMLSESAGAGHGSLY